ncbi:MAG TPA: prepilin peptidase, partial [Byssovorax sp.]
RCCKAKMSLRYPFVEAIGGLLSLAILEAVIFRLGPTTTLARAGAIYVADLALALGLVATTFIDLEFMEVPRSVTYGGAVLGIATSSLRGGTFVDGLVGAAVGFVVVWLPCIVIYPKIRGKMGMARGDADLAMLAGAWYGWQGALFALGAGAVQGTLIVLVMLLLGKKLDDPEVVKREREELQRELADLEPEERAKIEAELADDPLYGEAEEGLGRARVAFGPFLSLAMLECMLIGREAIWTWAIELLNRVMPAPG